MMLNMNIIFLLITFVSSEARRIDIDADIVIPDTGGLFGYSGDITRDWGQTVPYEFDDTFSNPTHKIYVTLAMKQLEDVATCINFVDVENDPNKGQSFIRFMYFIMLKIITKFDQVYNSWLGWSL